MVNGQHVLEINKNEPLFNNNKYLQLLTQTEGRDSYSSKTRTSNGNSTLKI